MATKELSQDAFFTWLLQWADSQNLVHDKELCLEAKEFVQLLIAKQLDYDKDITKVEAGIQWDNIDVWGIVNDEILIIIEDKTFTNGQYNPLENYRKFASEWCGSNNHKLACVYLKIGSEASVGLRDIEKRGFAVATRVELKDYFNKHSSINALASY